MTVSYTLRRHALEPLMIWQVAADALECRTERGPMQRWPYAGMAELRLQYDPTRFNPDNYVCLLTPLKGERIRLPSTHFAGIGHFDNRAADYRAFVQALTTRLADANPRCHFAAGPTPARFWAGQVVQWLALLLVAVVIGMTGSVPLFFLLLLAVIYLPLAWHYGRRNRPQAFVPPHLPEAVLPPEPRHD
ncbi:MAG: hypothetical protein Q8J78_14870 [Moraxellaceae bacterium]|nr:hypothetical protein [Moraxellaceae bacterium]